MTFAIATFLIAPGLSTLAAKGAKRPAPKPTHQPKQHVKAKAPHHPSHGAHKASHAHAHHNKKAVPKPTHHPKPSVKAVTHKPPEKRKNGNKEPHEHRHHDQFVKRQHEWSRNSRHENAWSRSHWWTHHFAHYSGEGASAGYHFDSSWWSNYVANPGTPNWGGSPQQDSPVPPQTPPQVIAAPPVVQLNQSLPISPAGEALAKLLDSMQVESRWQAYQQVDWRTGVPAGSGAGGPASNGGAFVAAVCNKLKAPLAFSDEQDFLPGNQIDWFLKVGKTKGWAKVGEVEAQVLANQGWVVVAAWKNMNSAGDRTKSGQTALVRPDRDPVSALAERGPRVIVAGSQNHNSIGLKNAFPAAAWSNQEIVYLAHRSR